VSQSGADTMLPGAGYVNMNIAADGTRVSAGWAKTTPSEKARLFLKASEIIKRRRSEIAEVLARETGSTISFATFQQDLVAATLQQVAGWVYLPKGMPSRQHPRRHGRAVAATTGRVIGGFEMVRGFPG
jgi:acyl-CoA reductase-like NAD-dependent aldehyde dehydrogenase